MTTKNGNNLESPVPAFCLAVEEYRRTDPGRALRSATEFRTFLFPYDETTGTDNVFHRMPNDVRGPILSAWGIRGSKSALKDTDEKVRSTVHDSFVAGDIDDATFEDGLKPDVTVRWLELATWWRFVRGGKLDRPARRMMLETAYRLGLFDAAWFFESLSSHGGKLHGTDAVAESLSKSELSDWIKKIHAGGDGSPKGILEAVGWEKVADKTAIDALDGILDAMAKKNSLVEEPLVTVPPDPGEEAPGSGDGRTGKPPAPPEDPEIADAMSTLDDLAEGRADPKAGEAAGAASGTAAAADAVVTTPPTETDGDDQARVQQRPSDAPSVSFSEEPLDAGDRSSSMDVDEAELLTADAEGGGQPPVSAPIPPVLGAGEVARPPSTMDWGEHAPDPRKSAEEASARAARNPRGSTSSVSYTPTPSSPRGREATLPSRPPPLPSPQPPQPPRRPPLPKGKGR